MLAFTVLFTLALTFLELLVWSAADHPSSPSGRPPRRSLADRLLGEKREAWSFRRLR
jgi:hypothetical protein